MKPRNRLVVAFIALILLAAILLVSAPCIKRLIYPIEYESYVEEYASLFSVPEPIVYAVIRTESGFDPKAESSAGAMGLMQLMPDTFQWLSSNLLHEDAPTGEITDPEANIKYGTCYLGYLYDRFGSWETALAAYNAGHGRVAGWLEDSRYSDDGKTLKSIPFEETSNYVNKISRTIKQYEELYYGE